MPIYLTLSAKVDTTGKQEIMIRFKEGNFAQRAKTNIFIEEKFWDSKSEQISPKRYVLQQAERDNLTVMNEELNKFTIAIQKAFNKADKQTMASDWLKDTIDRHNFPEKYIPKVEISKVVTLLDFVEEFIKEAPNRKDKNTGRFLTPKNIQQYKAAEKHLKAFAKSKRKKDFEFKEIDQTFYDNFVSYLQEDKEFTQNTVGKQIKCLKTILREASKKKHIEETDFKEFHVFTEDTDTIYLNEDELQVLKEKDLSKTPHLDRVRDWFLLLAWTGCRFSDLIKITKSDIKNEFITFRQQKTNTKVTIPLHPVVVEILEKYNYILPEPITNQKFNEYIKDACQIAEINSKETMTRTVGGKLETITFEKYEGVTSHTGRRSFATNMYKRGLPSLMIMSVTGHKTEKSFLKYIKVKQSEHAEMMKKAWQEMYKK